MDCTVAAGSDRTGRTPSFHVDPAQGYFHCFGCGEGGSVIDFVMKVEHLGFVEAVERLADQVGVQLTYTGGGPSMQRERGTRSRLLEANRLAAEFYTARLHTEEAAPAMRFLAERGFDEAAAQRFGCGFAPSEWDGVTKHLLAAGFTLDELYKAGLSKEGAARPDRPVPPPAAVADPRPRRRRGRLRRAPAVR